MGISRMGLGLVLVGCLLSVGYGQSAPAGEAVAGGTTRELDFLDKAVWQYQSRREWGSSLELLSVMGDRVIVRGNVGGKRPLLALDANTGKILWEMPHQEAFVILGELEPGTALLKRSGMLLKMVFPDGTVKWQNEFRDFTPQPLVAGTQIITGASTKFIMSNGLAVRSSVVPMDVQALNRDSGKQKWSYPLPEGTANTGSPVELDGKVVFVAELSKPAGMHCQVIALNVADGKVVYQSAIRHDLLSPPVLVNGELVSLSSKGQVVGLDPRNGEEKWHTVISPDNDATRSTVSRIPSYVYLDSPPVLAGDRILASIVGETSPPAGPRGQDHEERISGLVAVDVRTHRQVWFSYAPPEMPARAPNLAAPGRHAKELWLRWIQAGGGLIVARSSGTKQIYMAISQKEGKLLFTLPNSGDSVGISDTMAYLKIDNKLYAVPADAIEAK